MNIQQAIQTVVEREDLTSAQMTEVMRQIMTGEATDSQIGGFLIALRMKGETVDEVVGAATVMRELSSRVKVKVDHLVDTCGTGGDQSGTFNVSTAAALVTSAAGANVAKHGNRSVSSASGSADLLEAAGVNLDLTPEQVGRCIEKTGIGFLFAPAHHKAMRYAIGPRREMGVRTVFNVLGPLTNPAGAPNQVIGVFDESWVEHLARVLGELGSRHVMVVHAADGLDEISIGAGTRVAEFRDGDISTYTVQPEDFDMQRANIARIRVSSIDESLAMVRSVLDNEEGPARDIVALNAGAAIYVAGVADSLHEGVEKAREVIANGAARINLDELVRASHEV
ncbi:MAG: anthranilate phosphoribosyltransferase [Halofilum sp. (in: g-proteobacteria)]|nr:anthranilate phosphoribosyltransferase [Halofilum sp. (in: g-proteobacteria)]